MNRRAFVFAALALSGCASLPVGEAAHGPLAELEPLYRVEAGREGLVISVASNGCTTREDFAFYAERRGGTTGLAFGRKRVDICRSFAQGRTDLTFSWEELGVAPGAPVFLLNPVSAWRGPGN